MKRISAALIALVLVISTSITALGATTTDVDEKISSCVSYAFDGEYSTEGYTLKNAKNFYLLAGSGADVSAYQDGYLASVKEELDNGGLTTIDKLGFVVSTMFFLGVDPADFEGYNLVELLENADASDCGYNPYNYMYAVEAAYYCDLEDTAKAMLDALLGYYEMGTGTDFWGGYGTSADDIAAFLIALSYYSEGYQEYCEDAFTLLENYYSDNGYMSYGEPSSDSTAFALAAYSAFMDKEMADKLYDVLVDNFYDKETGGFTSPYDPYYATADALFALEYYYALADEPQQDNPEQTPSLPEPVKPAPEKPSKPAVQPDKENGKNDSKKSPATGTALVGAMLSASASMAIIFISKKHK